MKGVRAAVRYAKALMQLAEEKNLLDVVVADIKLIRNTIEGSRDLELLLQSPLVKSKEKAKVLSSVFGSKINELTASFLNQLTAHGRENILKVVCEQYINQYNTIRNIAKVSVTTSVALTDELRTELIKKIKSDYQLSEVELTEKVDESLLGGMVLRMGDKQLDASIRRQLNNIKQELVQA